jgi:hypothetical protein
MAPAAWSAYQRKAPSRRKRRHLKTFVFNEVRRKADVQDPCQFRASRAGGPGLGGDQVGCIRHFILQDGGDLRERLLALSDQERTFTYSILESPLPVANYIATVRLKPVTDGDRTFAEWSAEFDVTEGPEVDVIERVTGVFQGGFDSLKEHLG